MASWAAFVTSTLAKLGFTTTLHERTLNAAKMDYTGDTNLQTGMLRLVRAGSNTVYIEEWNGSGWAAQRWVNSALADLNADMVTSGTFNVARIPTITDGVHGARGGGDRHSIATSGSHGFMSSSDRVKLDALHVETFLDPSAPSTYGINSLSTEATWETYGYTASGADNVLAAIPTSATRIYVMVRLSAGISSPGSSGQVGVILNRRQYGSSAADNSNNLVLERWGRKTAGSPVDLDAMAFLWIPLTSGRFSMRWESEGILSDGGFVNISLSLLGYATAG